MSYLRNYRKCAFSGRLLFDADLPISEPLPNGDKRWFQNETMRRAYKENWPLERLLKEAPGWQRTSAPSQSSDIDPVSLEVLRNTLQSIVNQMAETMARTAYSPVFAEARDFTCA